MNAPGALKVDALIVSDIHLGSPVSQADTFIDVLQQYDPKILFIVGDLFDGLNLHRLKGKHWKALSMIRKMTKKSRVIMLKGNHDIAEFSGLEALLGIEVHNEFIWEWRGERILLLHGDIFDYWVTQWPILAEVFSGVYYWLQRLDHGQRLARWIKRKSKKVVRNVSCVHKRAETYCKFKRCDFVICGHTHYAELSEHYANSGSFCDVPSTFLVAHGEKLNHGLELKTVG